MRKPGRYLLFEVQTVTETPTALGQTESWATTVKMRGRLQDYSGYERVEGMSLRAKATNVVYFPRYRSGITTKNRLLLGSRIFNIVGVDNIGGMNREMRMFVEEVLS